MTATSAPPAPGAPHAVGTPCPVTPHEVAEAAGQVWELLLGLPLEAAPGLPAGDPAPDAGGPHVRAVIGLQGAWSGAIALQCSSAYAEQAAVAMFMTEPGTLCPDDVADALGELTNVLGGNLKTLLPGPSTLSVPSVADAAEPVLFLAACRPVLDVPLSSGTSGVRVVLWQSFAPEETAPCAS